MTKRKPDEYVLMMLFDARGVRLNKTGKRKYELTGPLEFTREGWLKEMPPAKEKPTRRKKK